MLTKLKIKNFKSIEESPLVEIRPLTVLVGPNSAGKSSLIQPLVLLRQTVDSADIASPLSVRGKLDFGSYRDFIFKHDDTRSLVVEFWFDPLSPMRLPGLRPPSTPKVRFVVEFGYNRKTMKVFLSKTTYQIPSCNIEIEIKRIKGEDYKVFSSWDSVKKEGEILGVRKFYGVRGVRKKILERAFWRVRLPKEPLLQERLWIGLTERLSANLELLFSRFFYIAPLREWPQRVYSATGETPQDVGLKGERSVDVLWSASRRKKTKERLFSKVNRWMKEFGMSLKVELKRLGGNNYSIDLVDPATNIAVNLADVGFGASQILPIIVEGFYSPPKSILLVEHPDIHLHPRAQAKLADLFIEIAREEKKTLIIETHSEHLISRIQRRIAEGGLKCNDVSIYYFEAGINGTAIKEIKLDSMGKFKSEGLPEGFFEEDYIESLEHYKAMLEKDKTG